MTSAKSAVLFAPPNNLALAPKLAMVWADVFLTSIPAELNTTCVAWVSNARLPLCPAAADAEIPDVSAAPLISAANCAEPDTVPAGKEPTESVPSIFKSVPSQTNLSFKLNFPLSST